MTPGAGSGSTDRPWLCPVPHHPLLLLPLQGKCSWYLESSIWEGVFGVWMVYSVLRSSVFVYLIIISSSSSLSVFEGSVDITYQIYAAFFMLGHPLRLPLQRRLTAFVNCELSKIDLGALIFIFNIIPEKLLVSIVNALS